LAGKTLIGHIAYVRQKDNRLNQLLDDHVKLQRLTNYTELSPS
jgi:hypothetical protein